MDRSRRRRRHDPRAYQGFSETGFSETGFGGARGGARRLRLARLELLDGRLEVADLLTHRGEIARHRLQLLCRVWRDGGRCRRSACGGLRRGRDLIGQGQALTVSEIKERFFQYWTSVDADLGTTLRASVA